MANKQDVATPIKNRKGFDLSHNHITTERFYEPNVVLIQETAAKQTYRIKQGTFRRVTPMPLPPLTNLKCETKYYYVPMVTILPYWREMLTNTDYADGSSVTKPIAVPYITNDEIIKLFTTNQANVYASEVNPSTARYDFVTAAGTKFWQLTMKGRIAYKLLQQLGYDINVETQSKDDKMSALPFIAYCKVMYDHFLNPQFINSTTRLVTIKNLFKINSSRLITYTELDVMFDFALYLCYGHDYFVDSFVNPNGPNYQDETSISIEDNTADGRGARATNLEISDYKVIEGTAQLLSKINPAPVITKHGIDLLKNLQNWLTRNQLAGGRFVDRLLVQFGYKPNDLDARRSSFIDKYSMNVEIQPVLNHTETELADYAGYGDASQKQNDVNEIIINTDNTEGYIIAIDTIVPEVYYTQGVLRQNLHVNAFDFFTPQFDCLGTQAIAQIEVKSNHDDRYKASGASAFNKVFGYTPRYSEYKTRFNRVTGDYTINSVNLDLQAFTTLRMFNVGDWFVSGSQTDYSITQSKEYSYAYDRQQYNRIFYVDKEIMDPIYSVFAFDIYLEAPMKTEYDYYQFEHDDNKVEIEINGGFTN